MIHRLFVRIRSCDAGVAMMEFAIVLPLLILILMGTIEFSRYFIINQKLDKVVNSMADYTTQGSSVSAEDLDTFTEAAGQIMSPFDMNGTIIFTSVVFYANAPAPCTGTEVPCVVWQYRPVGSSTSKVGSPGGNATMPGEYDEGVPPGQNAIVTEVYYDFEPLFPGTAELIPGLDEHSLYKVALYKPRLNSLDELN